MSKSYKSFVKEYAMGLQVPSTSYMKPMGSLVSGKPLRKKEDVTGDKKVVDAPMHMPKKSAGKLDVTEPIRTGSSLSKTKKVDSKPNDGINRTTPSTKYKGLAFTQKVPNYTKA